MLLGLQLGSRESYESWLDFGRDLRRLLLDAPIPDGRTVLTAQDVASAPRAVPRHGRHPPPFIPDTNLLERTFVEVRRRTKIIGRFPGETSALSLIWAVLELASRGWRGVTMTPKAVAQIERIRRGHTPTAEISTSLTDQDVIAA